MNYLHCLFFLVVVGTDLLLRPNKPLVLSDAKLRHPAENSGAATKEALDTKPRIISVARRSHQRRDKELVHRTDPFA